jgi:hypothetical protein
MDIFIATRMPLHTALRWVGDPVSIDWRELRMCDVVVGVNDEA